LNGDRRDAAFEVAEDRSVGAIGFGIGDALADVPAAVRPAAPPARERRGTGCADAVLGEGVGARIERLDRQTVRRPRHQALFEIAALQDLVDQTPPVVDCGGREFCGKGKRVFGHFSHRPRCLVGGATQNSRRSGRRHPE